MAEESSSIRFHQADCLKTILKLFNWINFLFRIFLFYKIRSCSLGVLKWSSRSEAWSIFPSVTSFLCFAKANWTSAVKVHFSAKLCLSNDALISLEFFLAIFDTPFRQISCKNSATRKIVNFFSLWTVKVLFQIVYLAFLDA